MITANPFIVIIGFETERDVDGKAQPEIIIDLV